MEYQNEDEKTFNGKVKIHNSLSMTGICYSLDRNFYTSYKDSLGNEHTNPHFIVSNAAITTLPQYCKIKNYYGKRYFDDYPVTEIKHTYSPKETLKEFIKFIFGIENELSIEFSKSVKGILLHLVSEIDRNARHHSGVNDGDEKLIYFVFQFFKNKKTFNVTLLDEGNGFKKAFDSKGLDYKGIEYTLKEGISSRSNHLSTDDESAKNSGYGLYILSELVSITGGVLYICTKSNKRDNEVYSINTEEVRYRINIEEFQDICFAHIETGSVIFFEFNIDKLLTEEVSKFICELQTSEASAQSKNFYYPDVKKEIAERIIAEINIESEKLKKYIELGKCSCQEYCENRFGNAVIKIEYNGQSIKRGEKHITIAKHEYRYLLSCWFYYHAVVNGEEFTLTTNFETWVVFDESKVNLECRFSMPILNSPYIIENCNNRN